MSITTLHSLLEAWEAEKAADRDDTQTSPSSLGNLCERQLAYRLNLTTPTDHPDPVTVATVGSLIHIGIARLWDDDPDTLGTEVHTPGSGSTDALQELGTASWEFDPEDRSVARVPHRHRTPLVVRDTKTVAATKFDRWERNDGPTEDVWDQVMDYGARLGADPTWTMVVDALCREDGRTATYARPYDPAQADAARARLEALQERLTGIDPDHAPTGEREGRGDWFCDSCPWVTRCTGPDDRPNVTDLDPAIAADLIAEYEHWNGIANDAARKAKAARGNLRGTEGKFGEWRIAWTVTEDRWVTLDEPIVEKRIAGQSRIKVTREPS